MLSSIISYDLPLNSYKMFDIYVLSFKSFVQISWPQANLHTVDITATSFFFVLLFSCVCQVIIKANSPLASTELINRIKSKIHGNLTHGNFTQDQLTLLVKSEHVAVKKLGNLGGGISVSIHFPCYNAHNAYIVRDPEFRGERSGLHVPFYVLSAQMPWKLFDLYLYHLYLYLSIYLYISLERESQRG